MNNKPVISVIIPTLDEEKYLPQLLDCLLDQSYKNFEVIVVDGKSEDQTQQVAKKYEARFAKQNIPLLFIESSRQNVSLQRNLGAKEAKGTYLFFFDADVSFKSEYIERVIKQILERKSLFVTTWLDVDSNDPRDLIISLLFNMITETALLLELDHVIGCNIFIQKNLFEKSGGFSEKILIGEDNYFAHSIKKLGNHLVILKEPRLIYSLRRFRHEGRLTVLRKYALTTLHVLFKGPVITELFEYKMGGKEYSINHQLLYGQNLSSSMKKWKSKLQEYINELQSI